MNTSKKPARRKSCLIVSIVAGLAALAVVFTVGGFAFAASQEAHDSFCASCHTQPESTFYERSTASQPVDLASAHTPEDTRCIDCHSGKGLTGRLSAEAMGARNAAKWYTGTAVQPAVLSFAIGDQNCLKCHQDVVSRSYVPKNNLPVLGEREGRGEGEGEEAGAGHWHTFLTRWQRASASAGGCVTCHPGHQEGSSAEAGFMDEQNVRSTCEACHRVIGERE